MFDLPPPRSTIQFELASSGISKGLAQTRGPQLAVRPGLALGRFSIEASGKNIDAGGDGGVETLLSAGFATRSGELDLSGRIGLKSIHGVAAHVDRHAVEARIDASRAFGAVRASATMIFSPDDTGAIRHATFVEGGAAWDVARRTRIGARFGRRACVGAPDYSAYNIGITYDVLARLSADLRLFGTDASERGEIFSRRLIGSLRARF